MKKFIILILCLFAFTIKVNAETYNLDSSQVTSYYRVNNATLIDLNYNTWYGIGSNILSNLRLGFTPLNPKTCTEYGSCSEGLQPGQYLFDFYVLTDGAVNISNCNQLSSDFQNVDMTTGNWVSNQISSSCVDVSTYVESGYATYLHILYSFTANAFATEYRFYINYGSGWLNGSSKFKVLLGNVYDFDQTIINDFKQQKLNEQQINQNNTIINQNQTIIDQNNETNTLIGGESDDITSKSCGMICKLKAVINFINPLSENFFAYKLVELMLNMLKSLFIPEDMDFVTNFVEALESKLGFIAAIPVKIIEFTMSLATATWSEFKSIQLPSISIFGYNFWNAQEIDLTEAINIFKPFKYVTDCICVVICAQTLNKWREKFTGGGSGK